MIEKYRHELKYQISDAQVQMLRNRINHLIPPDSHAGADGCYRIRSLYFDDYENHCFRENEDGTDPREKFRIRIYNHSTQRITLECKRKERGKTHKMACPLTQEQTRALMAGKILPDLASQPPLLRKLTIQMLTRRMRPVVIVEYDRIPYVHPLGNVRVTLDCHISASNECQRFFDPSLPLRPILPPGQHILEVKWDELLPDYIYRAMNLQDLQWTSFSKFYLCRRFSR